MQIPIIQVSTGRTEFIDFEIIDLCICQVRSTVPIPGLLKEVHGGDPMNAIELACMISRSILAATGDFQWINREYIDAGVVSPLNPIAIVDVDGKVATVTAWEQQMNLLRKSEEH